MARAIVAESGDGRTPLVAKIERPAAVDNLDAILGAADAVMVARGDLGLEMPFERVPAVQKEITRRARRRGLPVIVATQVFDSMRTELRPTRAEVSDAANAVDDAVDAIMLTGETAVGIDPTRTVQTLDAVIRAAESLTPSLEIDPGLEVTDVPHNRALCQSAVTLAASGHADAIVAVTRGGKTAHMLSAFRPGVRIFAVTPGRRDRAALRALPRRPAAGRRARPDRPGDRAPAARAQPAAGGRRGRVRVGQRRPDARRRQLPPHPPDLTSWWRPATNATVEPVRPASQPVGRLVTGRAIHIHGPRGAVDPCFRALDPRRRRSWPPCAAHLRHPVTTPAQPADSPSPVPSHWSHRAGARSRSGPFRQPGCSTSRWSLVPRL